MHSEVADWLFLSFLGPEIFLVMFQTELSQEGK